MKRLRAASLISILLTALAVALPSIAWSAVELQNLPFTSPAHGTTINLPLTDQASAVGTVSSMRPSHSTGGLVLYGDLSGTVSGTFMVWVGGAQVESFVSIDSAPLDVVLSVPPEGFHSTTHFGLIKVSTETVLVHNDGFACELDEPGLGAPAKAQNTIAGGVPEDQGGVAHRSTHTFYDLLDYEAGSQRVPVLNSYPFVGNQNHTNTPRGVIYLDFNGGQVTKGDLTYRRPGFVRADDTTFILSNGDIVAIEDTFQVVAERLRPFSVNVTTDLSVFLAAPQHSRGWAFVTVDKDGGSATIGDYGTDDPAVIGIRLATSQLKPGMIASHEVGHLLGVDHFGPGIGQHPAEYDGHFLQGTGGRCLIDSSQCWNTPTGFRYQQTYKVYQWTQGEYTAATEGGNNQTPGDEVGENYVDSLHRIDQQLGTVTYREDDRPNTSAGAKTLVPNVEYMGVIERNTDVDVFKIDTFQTGDIVIDVLSLADHPEIEQIDGHTGKSMAALDIYAELHDASGQTVAYSNPTDSLDALIDLANAAAGTYTVHLSGTNAGNPTASSPTGYTDYGSIGSYSVSASYPANPALKPDLDVTFFTYGVANDPIDNPWWWEITPTATIKNIGDAAAPGALVQTYVEDESGVPMALGAVTNRHDVLEPGEQTTVTMYFPRDLTLQAAGDYLLGAKADADGKVVEDNEGNNLQMGTDVAIVTSVAAKTPPTPRGLSGEPGELVTTTSGQPVVFVANTTDPQSDAITYHWDFDNDGIADATSGPTPSGTDSTITHTFSSSGVRYVRVRAEADAGSEPGLTPWCYLPSNSLVVVVNQ